MYYGKKHNAKNEIKNILVLRMLTGVIYLESWHNVPNQAFQIAEQRNTSSFMHAVYLTIGTTSK